MLNISLHCVTMCVLTQGCCNDLYILLYFNNVLALKTQNILLFVFMVIVKVCQLFTNISQLQFCEIQMLHTFSHSTVNGFLRKMFHSSVVGLRHYSCDM